MLVTLLTDFGTTDWYVAAMRGVILSHDSRIQVVDLTHEVRPQDVESAAFLLLCATPEFPTGSVHLAVVDPGVGSARLPLVASVDGHHFVGPDNGLLSYVLDRAQEYTVRAIESPRFFAPRRLSATFHGRDLFAPVAAALATGLPAHEVGRVVEPQRLPALASERLSGGSLRGRVLHVDRFGSCVTSFTRDDLGDGSWVLRAGGATVSRIRGCYEEGEADEVFAIWGSAGFLDLAMRRDSAAVRLGIGTGAPVRADPRHV